MKPALTSSPDQIGGSPWAFPPPSEWPDDDLVAVGADLSPATLVSAYRCGLFPMGVGRTKLIGWWSPNPRGVLPLDGLRVTKSLRQSAKRFEIRVDTAFGDVMRACANPARPHSWITRDFITAYTTLHRLGWAHSVEAFDRDGTLAGGLYGVRVNGLFAGESMFHVQRDASKAALMGLVAVMREAGMTLLDVQWRTEHLASLGVIEVPRRQYLGLLGAAVAR